MEGVRAVSFLLFFFVAKQAKADDFLLSENHIPKQDVKDVHTSLVLDVLDQER